jgi:lipoate---protein ligase
MPELPGAHATAWRTLPFEHTRAADLVEGSAQLLDQLGEDPTPTLRWYRSTDRALVLGKGQSPRLLAVHELPLVTRSSGGGAVLMDDGLLSLDVLLPAGHALLAGDLSAVFLNVGQAWARALRSLGCDHVAVYEGPAQAQRRGSARQQLLAAICYATLGRGEVTVGGRKVVGLSQRRRRTGALIQCGLLRRWRPEALLGAFGGNADDEEILAAAAGLDELIAAPPDDAAVMAAVDHELEQEMTMTGNDR